MKRKLLLFIPLTFLWLCLIGAFFSLPSYAASRPTLTTAQRNQIINDFGSNHINREESFYDQNKGLRFIGSSFYTDDNYPTFIFSYRNDNYTYSFDGVGAFWCLNYSSYSGYYLRLHSLDGGSRVSNKYGTVDHFTDVSISIPLSMHYETDGSFVIEGTTYFTASNGALLPPDCIIDPNIYFSLYSNYFDYVPQYDPTLTLEPKWVYMSGNGLLVLNPSANVFFTDITLNNTTTNKSFIYSSGSGQIPITFNSNIADIGDRIQFVMIPKNEMGDYGDTYYLSQTLDLINITSTDHLVSSPVLPVSIPSSGGSSGTGDTIINVPVSGITKYEVSSFNPVTQVSSTTQTNYSVSVDYSNTTYDQDTINNINESIVNNYTSSSQNVVNNYIYYETNNNVNIDIDINIIQQTVQDVKKIGINIFNLFKSIRILFSTVFAFMPSWLIALIFGSITLIFVLLLIGLFIWII